MNVQEKYDWMVYVSCMTYNHAPYIVETMKGFTMQETDFPFVCAIADDASTDGEQDVINKYLNDNFDLEDEKIVRQKETDDYVLTFARHKKNLNCYFAVLYLKNNHYSIKKSKAPYLAQWHDNAKYIAICEGDDYWIDSQKLQKQVDFLETHPDYGLVRTNINRLIQDTQEIEKDLFSKKEWRGIKDTHEDYILYRWFVAPCTWLWLTELKREEKLFEREDCFTGDLALLLAFSKQKKIKYLPDTTAVYRVLKKSVSHFDNPLQEMNFWLRLKNTRLYFVQDCSFVVKLKLAFLLIKDYAYRIKHNRNRSAFLVCSYMKDLKVLFF